MLSIQLIREHPDDVRRGLARRGASDAPLDELIRLDDCDDIAIVDLVERWPELRPRYEADITPLALQLDAFARRLVAGLPEDGS